MAANALEEKINKIRLQNEEIKRRYEEVEADKKNAAKSNALVQMVPSSDWPERKEPPEFTRKETNKSNAKPKPVKEHADRPQQYFIGGAAEGKKIHKFAQGDGPPPDPKYNFLADSQREENSVEGQKDEERHKGLNKFVRNGPRKRGGGRDGYQKDNRKVPPVSRDGSVPDYDAWRAERNRIDEARINRQRTAEGNWRREWDNDKMSIEKESAKKDPRFSSGDTCRRDYKDFEQRHQFDEHNSNRIRGGNHRNSYGPKNHGHYDNQSFNYQNEQSESKVKGSLSPVDNRTVITTDKSIKVTLNHGSPVKGPVMSVKVNAPSIAGTGRVGPRQKTRVTYSSQSEVEVSSHQIDNFSRQKSFDEKIHFNSTQRAIAPKSPFASRKKESSSKSPYLQRKDTKKDEQSTHLHGENNLKSPITQKKKFKDTQKSPPAQMHFFTSSSQGLVPSRGPGQKRLNEAKSSVIKILGQTTENNEGTILQSEEVVVDKTVKVCSDNVVENLELQVNDEQSEEMVKDTEFIEEKEVEDNGEDTLLDVSSNADFCNEVKNEINESPENSKLEEKDLENSSDTVNNTSEDISDQIEKEDIVKATEFIEEKEEKSSDTINNTNEDISDKIEKEEIVKVTEFIEEKKEKTSDTINNTSEDISDKIEKEEIVETTEFIEEKEEKETLPETSSNTDFCIEVKNEIAMTESLENPKLEEKVLENTSDINNKSKNIIDHLNVQIENEEITKNIASETKTINEEDTFSKNVNEESFDISNEKQPKNEIIEKNELIVTNNIENTERNIEEVKIETSENCEISKEIKEHTPSEDNTFLKVNDCKQESNESKIENNEVLSELHISEKTDDILKKTCKLETQSSGDHAKDNVSVEIPCEGSCVPSGI